MLNSSEGRWRKRLHQPGNNSRRQHNDHQLGGGGGSHHQHHYDYEQQQQQQQQQGLLLHDENSSGIRMPTSSSSAARSGSRASAAMARHPHMMLHGTTGGINEITDSPAIDQVHNITNNSSSGSSSPAHPSQHHRPASTLPHHEVLLPPSTTHTSGHHGHLNHHLQPYDTTPSVSTGPSATGWLIDHPIPAQTGTAATSPNDGANMNQRGGGAGGSSRNVSSNTTAINNQSPRGAAAKASLVIITLVTYVMYHASMEALVDETGGAWAAHAGTILAQHASAGGVGSGGGSDGGGSGSARLNAAGGWGPGVSVITVSVWQSFAALCAGFFMSRARRKSAWRRAPDVSPLSDGQRTRRNRCLFTFAVAHLLGTALEYHSYGVVGSVAAEVLRATETAFFLALSLYFFGIHRRGLSSLPTLLLAFGLALGAAPAAGDFRVGGVGLEFSLAASFLLAVRAISAKMALDGYGMDEVSTLYSGVKMTAGLQVVILLAVEIPRAASGLPPRLLPHLWGVGIEDHEHLGAAASFSVNYHGDGAIAGGAAGAVRGEGGAGGWVAGEERARLALLMLVNGVCLYGHVLALFALLSRLSATVFAIVSGYLRAALVFVLLLSLKGSATYPRGAGMMLSTIGVVCHFYRVYVGSNRNKTPMSRGGVGHPTGFLNGEGEIEGGGDTGVPLPQLPVFLSEGGRSLPPASDAALLRTERGGGGGVIGGGDDLTISPGGRRSSRVAGGGGSQPQTLSVPLLGTEHDGRGIGVGGESKTSALAEGGKIGGEGRGGWSYHHHHESSLPLPSSSSGMFPGATSNSDEDYGGTTRSARGGHPSVHGVEGVSPSRFAWRWMGLRRTTTNAGAAGGRGVVSVTGGGDFPSSTADPCSPSPPLLLQNPPRDAGEAGQSSRFVPRGGAAQPSVISGTSSSSSGGASVRASNGGGALGNSGASFIPGRGDTLATVANNNPSDTAVSEGVTSRRHPGVLYARRQGPGAHGTSSRGGTLGPRNDSIGSTATTAEAEAAAAATVSSRARSSKSSGGQSIGLVGPSSAAGATGANYRQALSGATRGAATVANSTAVPPYGGRGGDAQQLMGAGGVGDTEAGGMGTGTRRSGARGIHVRPSSIGSSSVRSPSPSSSSSFSLNGFEVIDKEDMWS